jgi:Protein tyrosine and serine/threonine kinase
LTIGREIGKGAFGRVFIARAEKIGMKQGAQIVAIKQLKSESVDGILYTYLPSFNEFSFYIHVYRTTHHR